MGIREKLNENPVITTIATIVIIVVAGIFLIMRFVGHANVNAPRFPTKEYYSDDDGTTWFVDDASNIPPFDHNGKQAVRARLFRCGDGKPYVERLESYDEEARRKIDSQMKEQKASPVAAQFMFIEGVMVKRPGEKDWVKLKSGDSAAAKQWSDIMNPKCPDGKGIPRPVSPEENVQP